MSLYPRKRFLKKLNMRHKLPEDGTSNQTRPDQVGLEANETLMKIKTGRSLGSPWARQLARSSPYSRMSKRAKNIIASEDGYSSSDASSSIGSSVERSDSMTPSSNDSSCSQDEPAKKQSKTTPLPDRSLVCSSMNLHFEDHFSDVETDTDTESIRNHLPLTSTTEGSHLDSGALVTEPQNTISTSTVIPLGYTPLHTNVTDETGVSPEPTPGPSSTLSCFSLSAKEADESDSKLSWRLGRPLVTITENDRRNERYVDLMFCTCETVDHMQPTAPSGALNHVFGHRIILEQIPYVKQRVSTRLDSDLLHIPGKDAAIVETIVRSYYTDELQVTEETLEGILEMAEFLGIEDIINCWKIRAVALAQDNNSIIEAADTYITKNFSKLITSQSFLDLSYLQILRYLDESIKIGTPCKVLFSAIQIWVGHDRKDRLGRLYSLINLLDLGILFDECPQVLQQAFAPGSLLASVPACVQLHNEVIAQKAYDLRNLSAQQEQGTVVKKEPKSPAEEKRKEKEPILAVVKAEASGSTAANAQASSKAFCPGQTSPLDTKLLKMDTNRNYQMLLYPVMEHQQRYLEAFDFIEMKAYRIHKFHRPKEFSCLVQVRDSIYDIGGSLDGINANIWAVDIHSTKGVDIFHKGNFRPVVGPSLKRERRVFTAVASEHAIYSIGGDTTGRKNYVKVTNVAEKLEINTVKWNNAWKVDSYLYGSRSCHASTIFQDHIYVAGGVGRMKNDGAMNVVEMFSLVHENWSRASPMQSGRRCFRLLVAGGKMYAIGGEDAKAGLISSVEAYDPVIGGWTYVASMNHARAGFGAVEINGEIFVAGGNSENLRELSVEKYNSTADKWTLIKWPESLSPYGRFLSSAFVTRDYVLP